MPEGTATPIISSNLNEITLNGKTIQILPNGLPAEKNIAISPREDGDTSPEISNLTYTVWGGLRQDEGGQAKLYLFAHGQATERMPMTGTAQYKGNHWIYDITLDDWGGNAEFAVNFGDKTLDGTLQTSKKPIHLKATISGNTFSGEHNGVHTNGGFYGPDAAELSGVYSKPDQFSGAFGAEKQ
ncbi:hypothetical protein HMPREF9371_2230 [Neisseria shayeganii 871]|uniref:Transferrin-binding protein B C-lobe/N-lobe beta-barrel domain-containing protein n=1 Tax=Neisseria shayeganii 871 TaxID=1032488 RepID=G4CKU0_9NEIS|nr:hypothetical protein HMPREF9371_2230 [Neisseria shayeganii 871]